MKTKTTILIAWWIWWYSICFNTKMLIIFSFCCISYQLSLNGLSYKMADKNHFCCQSYWHKSSEGIFSSAMTVLLLLLLLHLEQLSVPFCIDGLSWKTCFRLAYLFIFIETQNEILYLLNVNYCDGAWTAFAKQLSVSLSQVTLKQINKTW